MRGIAGSAATPAARCRKVRRGSFKVMPHALERRRGNRRHPRTSIYSRIARPPQAQSLPLNSPNVAVSRRQLYNEATPNPRSPVGDQAAWGSSGLDPVPRSPLPEGLPPSLIQLCIAVPMTTLVTHAPKRALPSRFGPLRCRVLGLGEGNETARHSRRQTG